MLLALDCGAGEAGEWRRVFTDAGVVWPEIERTMEEALKGAFEGEAYGFSKVRALLHALVAVCCCCGARLLRLIV